MTSFNHTPGPWIAERHDLSPDDGRLGIEYRVMAQVAVAGGVSGRVYVAKVHGLGEEQKMATSRLIAAAPDMLEALIACCEPVEPGQDCCLPADLYSKVCAAIAKAEGGTTRQ
jgi:hypothetical protein